jgi:large subunit ribosomal protein L6
MSRIGKKTIPLPDNVNVAVKDGVVEVSGPKGTLSQEITGGLTVNVDADKKDIRIERPNDSKENRALHGLYRSLIANMVQGVVTPFERRLEIKGVGYNAKVQGSEMVMSIGFCHPVKINVPAGIEAETPRPTIIVLRGPDKQKVGQLAADIRKIRPPEPYNGKGIHYEGERVRRKAGKTFVGGAT